MKAEKYDVDLRRGLCLKPVNKRTFTRVQTILDKAGARPSPPQPPHPTRDPAKYWSMPEESIPPSGFVEGAARSIVVNVYERDPEARRRCVAAHGTNCCVCGFNFGAVYGPVAEGYIHVHHLHPLSQASGAHAVDPVADLRPVCPNCHALLHLGGECRGIEEVRRLLR